MQQWLLLLQLAPPAGALPATLPTAGRGLSGPVRSVCHGAGDVRLASARRAVFAAAAMVIR